MVLFVSHFVGGSRPCIVRVGDSAHQLANCGLLPPFPFFPQFVGSSSGGTAAESNVEGCRFGGFFVGEDVPCVRAVWYVRLHRFLLRLPKDLYPVPTFRNSKIRDVAHDPRVSCKYPVAGPRFGRQL